MTAPSGGEAASPHEDSGQPHGPEPAPHNSPDDAEAQGSHAHTVESNDSEGRSSAQTASPADPKQQPEPGSSETPTASDQAAHADDSSQTGHGMPIPMPPVSRAPAGSAFGYDEARSFEQFRLAVPPLDKIVAGPAVGSMISGIGALLVALIASCMATGVGMVITVATIVLAVFFAAAAGLLAGVSLRQIKRGVGEYSGRGMAISGLCCGAASVLVVFFAFLVVFAVEA